jgi:hypothetical protein
MTLGNMREQGVHHLIAFCLNDACRHQALIDVSSYPAETEVPSFKSRVKCSKCRAAGATRSTSPELARAAGAADQGDRRLPLFLRD